MPAPAYSLTSSFREHATPEEKRARHSIKVAASARNRQNRIAWGNWHRACRGNGNKSEVPVPVRRTN